MRIVPIEQITIGATRQRSSFDPADIMELATSITARSLLHPIVVREDPDSDEQWILVAGERRLRAIRELWDLGDTLRHSGQVIREGFVPIVTLGELDPLEAEEAELEENVKRKDLTWQEHARATKRLAELRIAQAAERGVEPPSIADIAEETFVSKRDGFAGDSAYATIATKQEILIADHLDDEDVVKAKTLSDAMKVVRQKETAKRNAELAERIGAIAPSQLHDLLQGDSEQILSAWQGEKFDVLLTDPPYGMGADEFGDSGGAVMLGVHSYKDDEAAFASVVRILSFATAHTKDQAHAYVFCDFDRFRTLREAMGCFGWTVFRTPLIWIKNNGRVPLPQHGPRRQYELILYAFRGNKMVTSIQADTIECPTDENLGLGAQKPVELYCNLLRRSVKPGDRVLDPFAGTGTIIPAAHSLRCRATAIERSPQQFGIAAARLERL